MSSSDADPARGLRALRIALAEVLREPSFALAHPGPQLAFGAASGPAGALWAEALVKTTSKPSRSAGRSGGTASQEPSDQDLAVSSATDEAEATRLIALVELARKGDTDAFGMLYDHYQGSVYRFLYYRVGSVALAEDLTSETFFRALRSMSSFRWQGKDFGAWLMTIARNLTTDHYKSSKTRLETATEDMSPHDSATDGPEVAVLATLTNEALLTALKNLPPEQQECLVMRFLQGLSIAETAEVLGRSEGAIKQLQLRAVRNLAKLLPEGLR